MARLYRDYDQAKLFYPNSIDYRMVLKHQRLDRIPYLAIPDTVYEQHLSNSFFQDSLKENQVNLLVVNTITHEVDRWIPHPGS